MREAIREYETRSEKLSNDERDRMLAVIDHMLKQPPTRPQAEVDAELRELRASRRRSGRRHSAE